MILNLMFSYPASFWGKQALFRQEMRDMSCVQNQVLSNSCIEKYKEH